jgi:ATP-dependent helicase HrpA
VHQDLPVHAKRDDILRALRERQTIVVVGETGSGKTTLVPRFLHEAGYGELGMIGVTEPRRIAAVSVADYVAKGLSSELGGLVGYQIRHENRTGPATRIKYMTEGILLREMLADPMLTRYAAIILDEIHERNVNQDMLLALTRELLPRRPDLKLVVMSATMDATKVAEYFDAAVVHAEGRVHPVAVEYLDRDPDDFVIAAVDATRGLLGRTDGDVLVFVPDYASIRDMMELFERKPVDAAILPLYGNQSPEEQMAVFSRTGRSVIIATNVAETSITLDGVTGVVDTGKIKEMRFRPGTSVSALKVVDHARAGCDQRAGRAGRTSPGICVRLYRERGYLRRRAFTEPEIRRSNLDQSYLHMRAMGFDEDRILGFGWLDAPERAYWENAKDTLEVLGALDDEGELTELGWLMSDIPLPPTVTKMVVEAKRYGCIAPVITVAASFSTRPVFIRPPGEEEKADDRHRRFRDRRSDFLTLLNAIHAWRKQGENGARFAEDNFLHQRALEEIEAVSAQIAGILRERGFVISTGSHPEEVGRSIAAGLAANLLSSVDGKSYRSRKRDGISIHPGSSLYVEPPRHAVAAELVETTRLYARNLHAVPSRWMQELFPQDRKKRPNRRQKQQRYFRPNRRR